MTQWADISTARKVVFLHNHEGPEPLLTSWGRDTVSFGALIATAWVLNTQMPPSGWVNAALAISWILWMLGKGAKRRLEMTPSELREWLDEHYPSPPVSK